MKTFITRLAVAAVIFGSVVMNFASIPAVHAAGPNLIQNANLNEVDPANSKLPRYWLTGKWGTNTATFTYPASSTDSTSAAKLAVTAYTSGDAKWYFQPVTVTPNTSYSFSASYTSTAVLGVVAQVTSTTNVVSYLDLGTAPVSAGFSSINKTFTTPAGASKVSIFVLLNRVGAYTVDNYVLATTDGSTTTPPVIAPSVSLTSPTNGSTLSGQVTIAANASSAQGIGGVRFLVDAAQVGAEDTSAPYSVSFNSASSTNGAHTVTAIARDTQGNTSTSTVSVTVNNVVVPPPPQGSNLILNASLEDANPTNASLPNKWQKGSWGTNTTTFTYPGTASTGARGATVSMSAYTNGDAKWFFDDVAVAPSTQYTFSEAYSSTVQTTVMLRYTSTTGAVSYVTLGTPVASGSFAKPSWTFTTPSGVKSLTVFHLINKVGTLSIDDYSLTTGTTTGTTTPPTGDTQAPTVSVTNPTTGTTTQGTINLTATAADNTGVSGVQFYIDGTATGAEDTSSPYVLSFNTASVSNGAHTVSARARDAAGNTATSTVSFTVSNVVGDTTKPTVSFASPSNGVTATGTLNVAINAADNVAVATVKLLLDGTQVGSVATTSPYEFAIDTTLYTNASHVLRAEATDAAGNVASTSISVTFNNPVPDTTAPIVSIVTPTASSTLSGTTTISVSANDNIGVSMVHITVDTQDAAILDSGPYQAVIDTTSFNNGVHTISAYAVDAAGNIGNATPISVIINNAPVTPPVQNLIVNPSLETPDAVDGTKPDSWDHGFWGTNDATFSYPVAGTDGSRAARVAITTHADGDAKWFFKDVPVTVGGTYNFSEKYKASTTTVLTARFSYASGTPQYRDIVTLPAAADWTSASASITIPADAVGMTLFHLINRVGTLDIDAYSLSVGSSTPTDSNVFTQGMVSFTFDDGWTSQYTNALPILQAANIKAGFYIITNEMDNASIPNNRLSNPDFEAAAAGNPNRPAKWTKETTGTNNAVLSYPVAGMASTSGARVQITSYANGEAAWVPNDMTVIDSQDYEFSTDYKSTAATKLIIKYTFNDGTTTMTTLDTIPASANWTHYAKTITTPTSVKSVTIYQALQSTGTLDIDNTYLNQAHVYMNVDQVKAIYNAGHEVGSHTLTHPHLTTLPAADAVKEILDSKTDLISKGISPANTFIYPYGDYNADVVQMVKNAGYIGARSVDEGYNLRNTDKFILQIQQVDQTTTQSQFQTWVDSAKANKTWLILMFHQVENGSVDPLGVTPALLQGMVNYVNAQGVPAVTMSQGLAQMLP